MSELVCEYCTKQITDTYFRGEPFTKQKVADISIEKYGVALHIECVKQYEDLIKSARR